MEKTKVERILQDLNYHSFKWISGTDVDICHWPRFKCTYGCSSYGKKGSCPPSTPSVAECREFIREYQHIVVIHFSQKIEDPEKRGQWSKKINLGLIDLEREVFLAGNHKAFILFMDECQICEDCPGRLDKCKNPQLVRPTPESLCFDVFSTVRKVGFPIEVLTDYQQEMNRYAFLLVD